MAQCTRQGKKGQPVEKIRHKTKEFCGQIIIVIISLSNFKDVH